MTITTTSSRPFGKIFIDIVGPLNQTDNFNKFLLTFQDDLTKFSIAIPIPDQTANTVAYNSTTKIICQFGAPNFLVTDQGTNFLSQIFKETCRILEIKQIQCTSYHPQSDGSLERSHRTLVEYLRSYINKDMNNWHDFMPFATFVFNTTPHSSTGYTPFELLYGHKANLPTSLTKSSELLYSYDDYYNELKSRMQHSHEIAGETILKHKDIAKTYYDKNSNPSRISEGDKVLLKNEHTLRKIKETEAQFMGPYEVISIDSDTNCTIIIKRKPTKVHFNRLKLFNERE
ncbi:hypothetical protein JTB14_037543 [Gonioctena quinquepunctata]|nr:hypothetical protein JTB14_037543 [Gonioctena quinquepunctata]